METFLFQSKKKMECNRIYGILNLYGNFQQVIVMFMSVVVVAILGTVASDGIQSIFEKASQGDRLTLFKYVFVFRFYSNLLLDCFDSKCGIIVFVFSCGSNQIQF